jgi:hypothetical protein
VEAVEEEEEVVVVVAAAMVGVGLKNFFLEELRNRYEEHKKHYYKALRLKASVRAFSVILKSVRL